MKVIITGVTGMVGEGVLLECLDNPEVTDVLVVGRKHFENSHIKFKELILMDFSDIALHKDKISQYDACFFCAGVSSVGESEESFTKKTYDFVVPFAKVLSECNQNMTFIYVSGKGTDSTEKGKLMWARVKGRTENALMKLPFKQEYNFRPAIMKATKGQKNVKFIFRMLIPILAPLSPVKTLTLTQVGKAMIHSVSRGYPTHNLEPDDIYKLSL